MGKFRALAPAPGKTWLRSTPAPSPCWKQLLFKMLNFFGVSYTFQFCPFNYQLLASKQTGEEKKTCPIELIPLTFYERSIICACSFPFRRGFLGQPPQLARVKEGTSKKGEALTCKLSIKLLYREEKKNLLTKIFFDAFQELFFFKNSVKNLYLFSYNVRF